MIKVNLYSSKGVKKGDFSLPKKYEENKNLNLLAQAIYVYRDRSHPGNSKVKTRGEVIASTRKIYRQKGTGGARHGSVKAPIFVGGGKSHGPKGVKRMLKLSSNMKKKALYSAFNLKQQEKKLISVDNLKAISKTKDASRLIKTLYKKEIGKEKVKNVLVAISNKNKETERFFRNLSNVKIVPFKNLNALDVFRSNLLVLDKEGFGEVVKTKPELKSNKVVARTEVSNKNEKKSKTQKRVTKKKK